MVKRKGGVNDISLKEVNEGLAEAEIVLGPSPKSGGKRKAMRGGACSPEVRQRVRILVATALAAGAYTKGADVVMATGETVKNGILSGISTLTGFQCSISMSNAGISNLLCSKYFELLDGVTTAVKAVDSSKGLQTLSAAALGAGAMTAIGSLKDAVVYVGGIVKSGASAGVTGFEALVDQICAAMPPIAAPAAASGLDALAAAAAADTTTGGKRRKTRRGGMKRSRVAKGTLRRMYRY